MAGLVYCKGCAAEHLILLNPKTGEKEYYCNGETLSVADSLKDGKAFYYD